MNLLRLTLVLLTLPSFAATQSPTGRPEILVLGTYHMDNPGRDLHSTQSDDVLSARRQTELAELMEVLRRFHPTKIAVESNVTSQRVKQQYANYQTGAYVLTRNEIDQIGYRLAKELGLPTVYPVDEDGDFPFYRVRNYAIANGMRDKFEALQASGGERVKAVNAYLLSHSVLQTLTVMNADSTAASAVAAYYSGFLPFGEPYEYAGPDLIASWIQRNLRIYRNIRALISSPDDRILVIYGSGHLGWLRTIIASDTEVRLRTLADIGATP